MCQLHFGIYLVVLANLICLLSKWIISLLRSIFYILTSRCCFRNILLMPTLTACYCFIVLTSNCKLITVWSQNVLALLGLVSLHVLVVNTPVYWWKMLWVQWGKWSAEYKNVFDSTLIFVCMFWFCLYENCFLR